MKTAVVLVDMLSTFYIQKYNDFHKYTLIDKFVDELGGTLFINANTGSADTPRSISELLSGTPSYLNGCNTRLRYPRFNLTGANIFDKFLAQSHSVKIYTNRHHHKLGVFPQSTDSFVKYFENDNEFRNVLSNHKPSEMEFVFIYLSDYHDEIDNRGANIHSVNRGQRKVYNKLRIINEILNISGYDNFFILSDHGHLITRDYKINRFSNQSWNYNFSEFIGPKRNRLFLFWHKKVEKSLVINSDFISLMTINNLLNYIAAKELKAVNENLFKKNCNLIVQDYLELNASSANEPDVLGLISLKNNKVKYKSTLNNLLSDHELNEILKTVNIRYKVSKEDRGILVESKKNILISLINNITKLINNLIYY